MTPCTVCWCIDGNVSEELAASVFGVDHSLIHDQEDRILLNSVLVGILAPGTSNPNGHRPGRVILMVTARDE
jgi:hypothetical protein